MKIKPPYTIKQLEVSGLTKRELVERMGLEVFDTALPQSWLNWFQYETRLNYYLILGTTVWCYDGDLAGHPVSGCIEVQEKIEELN